MSQGGLDVKDLLADPYNASSPVEAMQSIMIRGKEHGWTTSQLFGVFLEVTRTGYASSLVEISEPLEEGLECRSHGRVSKQVGLG